MSDAVGRLRQRAQVAIDRMARIGEAYTEKPCVEAPALLALLDVAERASEVMAVTVEERTCCPQCEAAGKEPWLSDDERMLRTALDRLDKETP